MDRRTVNLMNKDVLVRKNAPPTAGMSAARTAGLSHGWEFKNAAPIGPYW